MLMAKDMIWKIVKMLQRDDLSPAREVEIIYDDLTHENMVKLMKTLKNKKPYYYMPIVK